MIKVFEPHFDEADVEAVANVIRSGYINEHKLTREFEGKFAELVGSTYAVATNNGTVALFLALKAAGVQHGNKIIVPTYTMIGTANAVRLAGAIPILADVDLSDGNLDASLLEDYAHDSSIKAIIPVHINGRACDMSKLREVSFKYGWKVIEDAAQTLGSKFHGRQLGTFGDVGCFSTATTKIITTGQGGVVVTNEKEIYHRLMELKDQGRDRTELRENLPDYYPSEGYNFKFTEIQAALGLSQMTKLTRRIDHKRSITGLYKEFLANIDSLQILPTEPNELLWYIDILTDTKGENAKLKEALEKKSVETQLFFKPLHTQPLYRSNAVFPQAEEFFARGLWLPTSSTLKEEDVEYICKSIRQYYE